MDIHTHTINELVPRAIKNHVRHIKLHNVVASTLAWNYKLLTFYHQLCIRQMQTSLFFKSLKDIHNKLLPIYHQQYTY